MNYFCLINKMTVKPGQRDQVIEIVRASGQIANNHPECIMSLVAKDAADANVVWVQDIWTSEAAHKQALSDPRLRPYFAQAAALLEGMPQQNHVLPVIAYGLPEA